MARIRTAVIFVTSAFCLLVLSFYWTVDREALSQPTNTDIPTAGNDDLFPDPSVSNESMIGPELPDTTPPKREPFLHPQCGTGIWQRHHAKIQRENLAGPLENQRIAIMDAYRNGAGDRLTMTVTVFLYSLLTDRAFKIKWDGGELDKALTPHWIDWVLTESDTDENLGKVEVLDYMTVYVGYEDYAINKLFGLKNFTQELGEDVRTVTMRLNQGQIWKLFDNPHYRDILYEWGLTAENAFGCVMSYLFELSPEAIEESIDEWREFLKVDDPVSYMAEHRYAFKQQNPLADGQSKTIALQIRYGDDIMGDQSKCKDSFENDDWTKKFFSCASDIDKDLAQTGMESRYFIMSDCLHVGEAAVGKFGSKIVSSHDAGKHIEHFRGDIHILRKVFSEAYLFSLADYHIISSSSSFGKLGAFMSLRSNHMFTFDNWNKKHHMDKVCNLKNWDTWRDVSRTWVRV